MEGNFDGVAHTASPVVVPNATPDGTVATMNQCYLSYRTLVDYFRPAIEGTTGILESIKSYG